VEEISDDPRHVGVTFLWRGGRSTESFVVQPFLRDPQCDYALTQIRATDIWLKTVRMRRAGVYCIASRIMCRFSFNRFPMRAAQARTARTLKGH
jgi:hypothetical protein